MNAFSCPSRASNFLLKIIRQNESTLLFLVVLMVSHFVWKWVVNANPYEHQISLLSWDVTPFFYQLSLWTATVSHRLLQLCGVDIIREGTHLYSSNNLGVNVIWGCTAVKQIYIFSAILLFSKGSWRGKLYYLPFAIVALVLFNILRIAIIAYGTHLNFDYFDTLHELFRFLYYGFIFILWVLWEEKLR